MKQTTTRKSTRGKTFQTKKKAIASNRGKPVFLKDPVHARIKLDAKREGYATLGDFVAALHKAHKRN